MELRLLRYFVAVAEELHFGRAARRLLIAQPSLSTQIRKLERDLGTALFVRDRHGVALTPAGEALLDPARQLLAAAADLPLLARRAAAADASGELTIGYVPYARSHLLGGLLEELRHAEPGCNITVRAGNDSVEVFNELRDGVIDAGILRSPPAATWLRARTLATEPFRAALPAAHPLAGNARLRLSDLRDERFALFGRELNPPAHDHLMTFFTMAGFTPVIGQASRRMDESLAYVASGAGVGLIPASATNSVSDPRLTFRPVSDPTPTVDIVLVWDAHSLNPLVHTLSCLGGSPGVTDGPTAVEPGSFARS